MFNKVILSFWLGAVAVAAGASPGYISSTYALGSQSEHTIRGYGGLATISKQSKAVDSPYATVRKTDIRLTNDAAYSYQPIGQVTYTNQGHSYGSPAIHGYQTPTAIHGYQSPTAIHSYQTPATIHGYHQPTAFHSNYHTTGINGYSTPTAFHGYHAPSGTLGFARPAYTSTSSAQGYAVAPASSVSHGYPTVGYSHGALHTAPTATVTKSVIPGRLGVAYSPATAVATSTFTGYGVHYGY